jgi:hypothetical protein
MLSQGVNFADIPGLNMFSGEGFDSILGAIAIFSHNEELSTISNISQHLLHFHFFQASHLSSL